MRFDEALVLAATWSLRAVAVWAIAIVAALLLEVLTAGRVRATWACPPSLRRAVLAGLGLLLSGGAVGLPAVAAPPRPAPVLSSTSTLPVPARPVGGAPPDRTRERHEVVVRPGDTLWGLAEDALPAHPRAPDVADLVARTFARNRAVIGPDPDHLEPGQHLLLPHPREERP